MAQGKVLETIFEKLLSYPFPSTAVTAKYQVPPAKPVTVAVTAEGLLISMLVCGRFRYDVP
jgi:hypothetical protein